MTFEDWMRHRGLSASSIEKYAGAIRGPLSSWAMKDGLIAGPLYAIQSASEFQKIAGEISKLAIFVERNQRGHNMYSSALAKFAEYLGEGFGSNVEEDIGAILDSADVAATERLNLVKSRIGQGIFRQKLLLHWKACAVTGYNDTNLLVASHIKPWRACSDSERLNPFNGLLLSPNLDKAFDSGLITFQSEGAIAISPLMARPEVFGVQLGMRAQLRDEHQMFMEFHRERVFRFS